MHVFERLQALYSHELFEEVINVHELCPPEKDINLRQAAVRQVMIADAYHFIDKYNLSLRHYHEAIQLYSQLPRPIPTKHFTDADIRFRYHQCLVKLKKYEEALGVLGKIPEKSATPKVQYAIAKLIATRDNNAPTAYVCAKHQAAVLSACPYAVGTAAALLRGGFPLPEKVTIESMSLSVAPNLGAWLTAHRLIGEKQYKQAVEVLNTPVVTNKILVERGRLYKSLGMKAEAQEELTKAHSLDNEQIDGMDVLATLYAEDRSHQKELETLGLQLMEKNESTIEAHIAFGYLSRSLGPAHWSKALHFAYMACNMTVVGSRSKAEAMILKSLILQDLNRHDDAIKHLAEAMRGDLRNYDIYEAQVNIYLQRGNSLDLATRIVGTCLVQLPNDPRAKVLKARVLMRNIVTPLEIEQLLEPIVAEHPHLLEAVWTLMEYYDRTKKYHKAIEILKRLTNGYFPADSMGRLHRVLGGFMAKTNQPEKSYWHLTAAINHGVPERETEMALLNHNLQDTTPQTLASPPPILAPRTRLQRRLDEEASVARRPDMQIAARLAFDVDVDHMEMDDGDADEMDDDSLDAIVHYNPDDDDIGQQ